MKKITLRALSLLLSVLLCFSIMPAAAFAGSKITPDDAIAWAEAQVGKALDFDNQNGVQCVDLIQAYYDYLGETPVSGNGCDYATNPLPSGWKRVKGGVPSKGDILVYTYITSDAGHVAIYGGGTTMYHGRFGNGVVTKTTNRTYNWVSGYWGYIRPSFNKTASTGLNFRLNELMNVRDSASTSAKILGQLPAGDSVSVSQITVDNWGEITYNGSKAWICLDWSTYTGGTFVSSDVLNLRNTSSITGTILDTVAKSTELKVQKISTTNKNWGYVTVDGKSGWVCLTKGADREAEVNWLIVDISQWNDPAKLDWKKLKAAGVKAAIIRIGGRYVKSKELYNDDTFATHYKNAKAAGIHVGAYFFSYALTEAQAKEEAKRTISILQKNKCELDMPVFIDIEDYAESNGTDYQHSKAGKAVCTKVVNAFCNEIAKAGYYPGIYCSKAFAEDLIDASAFNDRAVWIAQYGVTQCGYAGNYDIWQYTRYGKLSGASGNLDLNQCYTDFPSLIKKLQNNEDPVPEEPTVPVEPETPSDEFGEHKAGNWETVTAATCTSAGKRQKKCTDCGIVLAVETIQPTAHKPGNEYIYLLDTSLKPGSIITSDIRKRLHSSADKDFEKMMYASAWETQGGTKLTYCTVCSEVLTAEYSYEDCSHTSVKEKTVKTATCTTEGEKDKLCEVCGKVKSASLVPVTSHKAGSTTSERESCNEAGMSSTKCSKCGTVISQTYMLPSKHTADKWTATTKMTCLTDGIYTATCTECGEKLSKRVKHPVLGDPSADGKITSADARIALRVAVGLDTITDTIRAGADINADDKLDASDARLVLRLSVGLENSDSLLKKYYKTSG